MPEHGPTGILGGTFDPVHYAHLRLAQEACDALSLSRVVWIPAGQPPHRAQPRTPAAQRLEMTRLAIAHNPAFLVDDALMRTASLQTRAGLYREAVASYEALLNQFKESSVSLDRAQFRMGEVYESGLKDPANAIACYEKLLVDHPHSVLVEQARNRIRRLRGDIQ